MKSTYLQHTSEDVCILVILSCLFTIDGTRFQSYHTTFPLKTVHSCEEKMNESTDEESMFGVFNFMSFDTSYLDVQTIPLVVLALRSPKAAVDDRAWTFQLYH